jgi:CubicO group peptidase (beta-lactamase class C family)
MKASSAFLFLALTAAASMTGRPADATTLPPAAASALRQLLDRGRETHSNAVLVLQDGRELGHYYPNDKAPGPIELMSVTKSVVALGIGQLLDTGKIKSLDQPVADFYPEWRQGRKKDITIRMLLDHTSGLQSSARTGLEVYPAPDAVQLALAAELSSKPGTDFFYNNKAVNLLAGIVAKASGRPMDRFFRDGLFKTMGIHAGTWVKDKAGNPYVMAGLPLTAMDLAKLGDLVGNRGRRFGRQIIFGTYIDAMLAASPVGDNDCGLLWWRNRRWMHFDTDPTSFAMLRKRGVPDATVHKLEAGLKNAHYDSANDMQNGIAKALGPDARSVMMNELMARGIGPYRLFKVTQGPVVAFDGNGDGGQYVVVVPKAHLVAVRQIEASDDTESAGDDDADFVSQVIHLAEATGALNGEGAASQ